MEKAAAVISRLEAKNDLVKGGHLKDDPVDVLWSGGEGERLDIAVKAAKQFISDAIQNSPGLGKGYGPVNVHARTEF